MAEHTPKHGLTRVFRKGQPIGWQKKINATVFWIASQKQAPDAIAADLIFEAKASRLFERSRPSAGKAADDPMLIQVQKLANGFLHGKALKSDTGMIRRRTYAEAEEAVVEFCGFEVKGVPIGRETFGDLSPIHFDAMANHWASKYGVDRRMKFINTIRSMFKWAGPGATGNHIVPRLPAYGSQFRAPTRRQIRLARKARERERGLEIFQPDEIDTQLAKADTTIKAMILLGYNAGFTSGDFGELSLPIIQRAIDTGWLEYARPKTGEDRKAWLWPETIQAIRDYLRSRPRPDRESFEDIAFLTSRGYPFVREKGGKTYRGTKDQFGMQFARLLTQCGQRGDGGRLSRAFRKTYRTTAVQSAPEPVVDFTMGHAGSADDMARVYTVKMLDSMLKALSLHVRSQLLKHSQSV